MNDFTQEELHKKANRTCLLGCFTTLLIIGMVIGGPIAYMYYDNFIKGTRVGEYTSPNETYSLSIFDTGFFMHSQAYSIKANDGTTFTVSSKTTSTSEHQPIIEWFSDEEACIWFPSIRMAKGIFYLAPNTFEEDSEMCK